MNSSQNNGILVKVRDNTNVEYWQHTSATASNATGQEAWTLDFPAVISARCIFQLNVEDLCVAEHLLIHRVLQRDSLHMVQDNAHNWLAAGYTAALAKWNTQRISRIW